MEKLLPDPLRRSRSQIRRLRGRWGQNTGYDLCTVRSYHWVGLQHQRAELVGVTATEKVEVEIMRTYT
jgi:hypothetical protein